MQYTYNVGLPMLCTLEDDLVWNVPILSKNVVFLISTIVSQRPSFKVRIVSEIYNERFVP